MNEAICLIAAMLCHLEVIIIVETSHFTTTRIITRNTSFIALCYVLLHILPCFLWLTRTSEWDGKMVCERFVLLFYALIREHSVYLFFFILFFQMIHKIAFQNFTRVSERKIDARWKKNLFIIYMNHGEENSCFLSHFSTSSHMCEPRRVGRKLASKSEWQRLCILL